MAYAKNDDTADDIDAFEDALEFLPSVQAELARSQTAASEAAEDAVPEDASEDATDTSGDVSSEAALLQAISEAQEAMDLFLDNQFEKAIKLTEPRAEQSMYHALANSALYYMRAVFTMERPDLALAAEVAHRALRVCQRRRRRRYAGLVSLRLDSFTDEQCHAELCYAELLLESAVLTFVQDETMVSFLKGGLRVRECHQLYRLCFRLLRKRAWSSERLRAQFESGARMGVGAFSLFVSLLPPTVLRLLQFIGFSGDRQFGLEQLEAAAGVTDSLRSLLAQLLLVGFYANQAQMMARKDCQSAERWLQNCRTRHPRSALLLYMQGRIDVLQGRTEVGSRSLELSSASAGAEWSQLRLLCDWELMWVRACHADWPAALVLAERLAGGSNWSKATMAYIRACFLYHARCTGRSGTGSGGGKGAVRRDGSGTGSSGGTDAGSGREEDEQLLMQQLHSMYEQVPKLCQRLAGRTLPLDKFAARRSQRWLEQAGRLTLPGLELLLAWGVFHLIEPEHLTSRFLPMVQAESDVLDALQQQQQQGQKQQFPYPEDDRALVLLLKAVCLRHLGTSWAFQAEQCLLEVTGHLSGHVHRDRHVIAWAWLELACLQTETGRPAEARESLDACRSLRGFSLEARTHMKAHAMLQELRSG